MGDEEGSHKAAGPRRWEQAPPVTAGGLCPRRRYTPGSRVLLLFPPCLPSLLLQPFVLLPAFPYAHGHCLASPRSASPQESPPFPASRPSQVLFLPPRPAALNFRSKQLLPVLKIMEDPKELLMMRVLSTDSYHIRN